MTKIELANFIKASVEKLKDTDDGTCYKFELDDNLAVYVGWGADFDENDETCIHSKSNPRYCICVKIAENLNNFWCGWEDAYMPWYEDGEVYDTDMSISPNKDNKSYENLAKWILNDYEKMKELLETKVLTF